MGSNYQSRQWESCKQGGTLRRTREDLFRPAERVSIPDTLAARKSLRAVLLSLLCILHSAFSAQPDIVLPANTRPRRNVRP